MSLLSCCFKTSVKYILCFIKKENNGRLNERVGTTSSSSSTTTTTKRSIKDRLGNNQPVKKTAPAKARSPTPPPRQSDNLAGITMSDFSSDGLSDESSEDEEVSRSTLSLIDILQEKFFYSKGN